MSGKIIYLVLGQARLDHSEICILLVIEWDIGDMMVHIKWLQKVLIVKERT
ncbi:MAG: hypothetical protein ACYTBS_12570 [Planctomycetota bacterium]